MQPQGILMRVHDVGVLLCGDAAVGKSDLALELLSRGHQLIADDAPDFHDDGARILGSCPAPIKDLLEVRGMGILNIRAIFGPKAVRDRQPLDLLIQLHPTALAPPDSAESRLCGNRTTVEVLGRILPQDDLYIAAGRHLAARAEAMALRHRAEANGYRLTDDLESRRRTT